MLQYVAYMVVRVSLLIIAHHSLVSYMPKMLLAKAAKFPQKRHHVVPPFDSYLELYNSNFTMVYR